MESEEWPSVVLLRALDSTCILLLCVSNFHSVQTRTTRPVDRASRSSARSRACITRIVCEPQWFVRRQMMKGSRLEEVRRLRLRIDGIVLVCGRQ